MTAIYIALCILAVLMFLVLLWYVNSRSLIKKAAQSAADAERGVIESACRKNRVLGSISEAVAVFVKTPLPGALPEPKSGMTAGQISKYIADLQSVADKITAVAAENPEISKDKSFCELKDKLFFASENLQSAVELYNGDADAFNKLLLRFPTSLVASRMCLEKKNEI